MSKVGRNDPCPCGSGKKYKKCCIDKETEAAVDLFENRRVASPDDWEDDIYDDVLEEVFRHDDETDPNDFCDDELGEFECSDDDSDDEEITSDGLDVDFDANEEENNEVDDDPRYGLQLNKEDYPIISKKERKLVDDWWDRYKRMKDPVIIMKHLVNFLDSYPQLVLHLEMHHEILFELGADYMHINKYDEYINLLFRIRKEFPDSYVKSAGYYDCDIIAWLIVKNRSDEIHAFLNHFIDYPIDFVDKLFDTIELLLATNHNEVVLTLSTAVAKYVTGSREVFGGLEINYPGIENLYSQYLKPGYSKDDIKQLVRKQIDAGMYDKETEEEEKHLKTFFDEVLRPYQRWENDVPARKTDFHKLHRQMVNNFMRYLKENTGMSWPSASFYSRMLMRYLSYWVDDSPKKLKSLYDFSVKTLDRISSNIASDMIYVDDTKFSVLLNAVYYFIDYLHNCGNIDFDELTELQKGCSELHTEVISLETSKNIEAHVFKQFPLFGKIEKEAGMN